MERFITEASFSVGWSHSCFNKLLARGWNRLASELTTGWLRPSTELLTSWILPWAPCGVATPARLALRRPLRNRLLQQTGRGLETQTGGLRGRQAAGHVGLIPIPEVTINLPQNPPGSPGLPQNTDSYGASLGTLLRHSYGALRLPKNDRQTRGSPGSPGREETPVKRPSHGT